MGFGEETKRESSTTTPASRKRGKYCDGGDNSGEREGAGGRFVCVSEGGMTTRRFRGNFTSRTHSQYTSRYMTNSCSIIIR